MPRVSVVIPAFNASWCIRDALDSVRSQTYKDYEVIVVNDGSGDSTHDVVIQWLEGAKPLSGRLIDQDNRRLGGARNTGIRYSAGEFVAFLDADDLWYPEKLARVVDAFDSSGPEVGLVCHNEVVTRHGKTVRMNRYGPYVPDMYRFLLFHGSCLSPSSAVVKAAVLETVGGFSEDPDVHSIEDYDLWLRLSRLTRFHFLREILGEYRLNPGSLSSDPEYNLRHCLNVIDRHAEEYFRERKPTLLDRYRIRRRRGLAFRSACMAAQRRGEYSRAVSYITIGLRFGPVDFKNWAALGLCASVALARSCGMTSLFS